MARRRRPKPRRAPRSPPTLPTSSDVEQRFERVAAETEAKIAAEEERVDREVDAAEAAAAEAATAAAAAARKPPASRSPPPPPRLPAWLRYPVATARRWLRRRRHRKRLLRFDRSLARRDWVAADQSSSALLAVLTERIARASGDRTTAAELGGAIEITRVLLARCENDERARARLQDALDQLLALEKRRARSDRDD